MSIPGKEMGVTSDFAAKEKRLDQQDVHEVGSSDLLRPTLLQRFDAWVRLDSASRGDGLGRWSNADLEPTIPSQQTWSSWNCT